MLFSVTFASRLLDAAMIDANGYYYAGTEFAALLVMLVSVWFVIALGFWRARDIGWSPAWGFAMVIPFAPLVFGIVRSEDQRKAKEEERDPTFIG